ncbi:MAG: hypothetical protein QOI21_2515 [Actinomycetota bacterium]|jgi:hypothetical protein|nr:hypothetical protein [Actinomycetota bacterium]
MHFPGVHTIGRPNRPACTDPPCVAIVITNTGPADLIGEPSFTAHPATVQDAHPESRSPAHRARALRIGRCRNRPHPIPSRCPGTATRAPKPAPATASSLLFGITRHPSDTPRIRLLTSGFDIRIPDRAPLGPMAVMTHHQQDGEADRSSRSRKAAGHGGRRFVQMLYEPHRGTSSDQAFSRFQDPLNGSCRIVLGMTTPHTLRCYGLSTGKNFSAPSKRTRRAGRLRERR